MIAKMKEKEKQTAVRPTKGSGKAAELEK